MNNQNLSDLPDTIKQLYQMLAPREIEQFYVGYQFLEAEQLALDLHDQISTLQQQIIENIGNIQATQPSALAMAALARLQSEDVRDPDLLDYLLLRGEEWLDQTMQRLDYCEEMGLIADNDYTKWCEHALEGAYDWIDSVRESSDSESSEPDTAFITQSEEDDPDHTLATPPLASTLDGTETQSSVHQDQAVSEENLLKLLASDGEDEDTAQMPAFLSNLTTMHEAEVADHSYGESNSPANARTDTDEVSEEVTPDELANAEAIPAEVANAETIPELAAETETVQDTAPEQEAAPSYTQPEIIDPAEELADLAAKASAEADDNEVLAEMDERKVLIEEADDSEVLIEEDDNEQTAKRPQVSPRQPEEPQKKDRSPSGIMATLMALKKKHSNHSNPPPAEDLSSLQSEEAIVELETAEAVGGLFTFSPSSDQQVEESSARDDTQAQVEPEASQQGAAGVTSPQTESVLPVSDSQPTDQDVQPVQAAPLNETTIETVQPSRHHSTASRRNSPFLMNRELKKIKKHKDLKPRRLSRNH